MAEGYRDIDRKAGRSARRFLRWYDDNPRLSGVAIGGAAALVLMLILWAAS